MASLWESVAAGVLGPLPIAYQYLTGGEPIDLGLRPPGDLIDLPPLPVIIGTGGVDRGDIAEALRLEESTRLASGAAEVAAEAAGSVTEVVDIWVTQLGQTARHAQAVAPEAAKLAVLGPLTLLREDPLAPVEFPDLLGAIPIWVPLLGAAVLLGRG